MGGRTVLAALTSAVLEAAVSSGLAEGALLAAAGLVRSDLADPDARVPLEAHARLWEAIARVPGDVGLAMGPRLARHALGVVGLAMRASANVGEALTVLERFRALVLVDAVPRVEREGDLVVLRQALPPRFARLLHPAEAQAAASLTLVRFLAREEITPARIAFPHARPSNASAHVAFFGRRPTWGAPVLELALEGALLARPLAHADPALFRYLARRAEVLLGDVRDEAPLAERVRAAVDELLAHGEPRLDDVARRLAVTPRTLHRRLGEAGTSFAALLDGARRTRAETLLHDASLGAYEVGYLLGYSDPAAFTRAFRRWTGTTPAAYRSSLAHTTEHKGPEGAPPSARSPRRKPR